MRVRKAVLVTLALALAGTVSGAVVSNAQAAVATSFASVVPAPVSTMSASGSYAITPSTAISTDSMPVGQFPATLLRRPTGFPLPVHPPPGAPSGITRLLAGPPPQGADGGRTLDRTGRRG